MGKMKMGHSKTTELGQSLIEAMTEIVDSKEIQAKPTVDIEAILQEHAETLKKLSLEREAPLATMKPSCECKLPLETIVKIKKDNLARKHSKLVLDKLRSTELDLLCVISERSQDMEDKIKKIEQNIEVLSRIEIPEIPELPDNTPMKRVLMAVSIMTLINFILACIMLAR